MSDGCEERIQAALEESIVIRQTILANPALINAIAEMARTAVGVYQNGGKLLIGGNGGSAADAQHFATEIVGQYRAPLRGARPALSLSVDPSMMTAWPNDIGFKTVFSRMLEAHGKREDALVVISTSGNSQNLIEAATVAKSRGIKVLGLLGKGGGKLTELGLCDREFIVPFDGTPRIQEVHTLLIHMICEELDRFFVEEDKSK